MGWNIGFHYDSICSVGDGFLVYKDTTSRLHGYGNALFVVRSPAWIHLMTVRDCFLKGLGHLLASTRGQEIRWVGPSILNTIGRILISGPVLWVLTRW